VDNLKSITNLPLVQDKSPFEKILGRVAAIFKKAEPEYFHQYKRNKILHSSAALFIYSALAARLMEIDGNINENENQSFLKTLHGAKYSDYELLHLLESALGDRISESSYSLKLKILCKDDTEILNEVICNLILVADSDPPINKRELEFLENIALNFGIKNKDLRKLIFKEITTVSSTDPYKILSLKRDASEAEIKSAYKKLAKLYHPDNFASKEMMPGYDKIIQDRFDVINKAYNYCLKNHAIFNKS